MAQMSLWDAPDEYDDHMQLVRTLTKTLLIN